MIAIDRNSTVAVVGTGTMGQGIAQVALVAGHPVRLYDAVPGRAERAGGAILARLDRLVEKGRITASERHAAGARLMPADDLGQLADAALVVEAILEQLASKQQLFTDLEAIVADDCLLATNTSSLSVTAVAGALRRPGRFVGLHFFNPAPVLPLVEVVSGFATDEEVAARAFETAAAWGKTPVRCADTPGFIVNRVARPFYAEAFRVYEERAADPATVDAVLREGGGFRMGAFELTDLIGQDVNEAVSRSVWESFFQDPKFSPALCQRRLVESGRHGRKSGRGWFGYEDGALRPEPHTAAPAKAPASALLSAGGLGPAAVLPELIAAAGISLSRAGTGLSAGACGADSHQADAQGADAYIELPGGAKLALTDGGRATRREPGRIHFDLALDYRSATRIAIAPSDTASPGDVQAAIGLFQALGKEVSVIGDVPGMIVARTVAMLADFAYEAVGRGVASPEDVDTAMRLGVNYPLGPLAWGERLGADWLCRTLARLHQEYPTGRYAASQPLRRRASATERLLSS